MQEFPEVSICGDPHVPDIKEVVKSAIFESLLEENSNADQDFVRKRPAASFLGV